MIHTPWSLGPVVPRCGMLGEHVRLRNGPCCAGVNSAFVCVAMLQWQLHSSGLAFS